MSTIPLSNVLLSSDAFSSHSFPPFSVANLNLGNETIGRLLKQCDRWRVFITAAPLTHFISLPSRLSFCRLHPVSFDSASPHTCLSSVSVFILCRSPWNLAAVSSFIFWLFRLMFIFCSVHYEWTRRLILIWRWRWRAMLIGDNDETSTRALSALSYSVLVLPNHLFTTHTSTLPSLESTNSLSLLLCSHVFSAARAGEHVRPEHGASGRDHRAERARSGTVVQAAQRVRLWRWVPRRSPRRPLTPVFIILLLTICSRARQP